MWFFLPVGKFFKNILSVCVPTHTVNRRLLNARNIQGESTKQCPKRSSCPDPFHMTNRRAVPSRLIAPYLCNGKANRYCLNVWLALYHSATSLMQEVYARVGFIYTLRGCQALEPVPNAYQYLQGIVNHVRMGYARPTNTIAVTKTDANT